MRPTEHGLVPASGLDSRLKTSLATSARYERVLDEITWSLTECSPLLDSANIIAEDWDRLAAQCLEHQQFDAIIIVHGTDTLAYTSSALAFLLLEIDIPIIVTGSQKPLEVPGSDALDNLVGAMLEAARAKAGVWVYFAQRLMPGARVVKKDAIDFAGFDTPRLRHTPTTPDSAQIGYQSTPREWASIQIVFAHMWPGYSAEHLNALIATRPDAIVLSLYGLGTLANQNEPLLLALHSAQKQGIVVVAISQCYIGSIDFSVYATGAQLAQLGVRSGRDITLEAAYAKLMVLFRMAYPCEQVKDLFETVLTHEMSEI